LHDKEKNHRHQFVYATFKFSESGFQPDLQKSILSRKLANNIHLSKFR